MAEQNSGKVVSGGKVKLSVGKFLSVGGASGNTGAGGSGDFSRLLPPSIVTPVLRDVGKLAASVAAVNTNGRLGDMDRSSSSGSATGNPRNKCALEPGHSLMDWIRLGNSGKDLTGVGALAGKITVSPTEMTKHNTREDAWIAIRGNVYNVTDYLAFHPGGVNEIMRGVGLPDATMIFDEVHPWVNYDKMLTKCFVGRIDVNITETASTLFESSKLVKKKSPKKQPLSVPVIPNYTIMVNNDRQVRFDWIQKHDILILYFYTGAYSNPYLEIRRASENKWIFVISFVESVFTFIYTPQDTLLDSPRVRIFHETGKIEVTFEKEVKKTWATCGFIEQSKTKNTLQESKRRYVIKEHVLLNPNTFMITLQNTDTSLCNTPLGYHIMLYNDENYTREYTPVPHIFIQDDNEQRREEFHSLTFLIRHYPQGRLSDFLYKKKLGDTVTGSEPIGSFDLHLIGDKQHFIFLSGGVGITPFLSIIQFLLDKTLKPIQKVLLVNFNQTQQHIFLHEKFQFMSQDSRFTFVPILTQPREDYEGLRGYLTIDLIRNLISDNLQDITTSSIFFFCCGPTSFSNACFEQLNTLEVETDNTFFFTSTTATSRE